jgi:fermentation-respiration switch protein FrsA (DUF1100 family)
MAGEVNGGGVLGEWIASTFHRPIEWLKNTLTFHPNTKLKTTPAEFGLQYEEVRFGGPDGQLLHGWYIPNGRPANFGKEPLFLWFHGNAGHIGHRLGQLRLLHEHIGGSHFLFDYQGFGLSQGKPTIPGIIRDGREALMFAQKRGWTQGRQVVYFGESLGCAVVLSLALEGAPHFVILTAPFYSLKAMGKIRVPPLAFLVEHDLNNARLVGQLGTPLLILHGTEDRTVPFQQGCDLYELAPQPKTFYRVEGGGHTNLHEVGGHVYIKTIREFLHLTV